MKKKKNHNYHFRPNIVNDFLVSDDELDSSDDEYFGQNYSEDGGEDDSEEESVTESEKDGESHGY